MRSVDGPVQAGDYVAIIVMGATLVKVQDGETILAGQTPCLTIHARITMSSVRSEQTNAASTTGVVVS